jgi:hypothetical protein
MADIHLGEASAVLANEDAPKSAPKIAMVLISLIVSPVCVVVVVVVVVVVLNTEATTLQGSACLGLVPCC